MCELQSVGVETLCCHKQTPKLPPASASRCFPERNSSHCNSKAGSKGGRMLPPPIAILSIVVRFGTMFMYTRPTLSTSPMPRTLKERPRLPALGAGSFIAKWRYCFQGASSNWVWGSEVSFVHHIVPIANQPTWLMGYLPLT